MTTANATATSRPVRLTAEATEEPSVLRRRGEQLARLSRCYLRVAAWNLVVCGVLAGLAWWWWPDATLKVPHLPTEIGNKFLDTWQSNFGRGAVNLLKLGIMLWAVCAGCFLCLSLYRLLVVGRAKSVWPAGAYMGRVKGPWPAGTWNGLVIAGICAVLSGWLWLEKLHVEPEVPRSFWMTVHEGVERADFAVVEKGLRVIRASEAAQSYLLAQVVTAQAHKSGKPMDRGAKNDLIERVKQLGEALPRVNFTVSPQAVYAIEVAAWGKPSSAVAVTYLSESQRKAGVARAWAIITGLLGFSVGVVGGGMWWLGRRIRARLERIGRLTS